MRGVKDVRQAEIHTAEPLVPEPSAAEVELAIDKPIHKKGNKTDCNNLVVDTVGGKEAEGV